ncbi:spermidine putrescine-binding periplasmic protein [Lasius niger]|uniref:Spermidine putrescine-binding periplasmic protein n=1 Tax=Lasius niger TaxID=67767 RepID=A0A0J7L9Z0_LASNI|nr:spermidine putrescine-binding periplasmic protein [Lasius niger]
MSTTVAENKTTDTQKITTKYLEDEYKYPDKSLTYSTGVIATGEGECPKGHEDTANPLEKFKLRIEFFQDTAIIMMVIERGILNDSRCARDDLRIVTCVKSTWIP